MTSNIPPYLENQDIDFKKIIRLIISNWLLILILIIVALIGAYLYIRYTQPMYRAAGTIIVKDETSNSLGQDAVQLQGLDFFKMNKNLSTEIEIIKSKLMVERAVHNMPFPLQVSYFAKGRFKTTDLYSTTPFIIEIDSLSGLAYEKEFNIKFVNDKEFEYSYENNQEKTKRLFKIGETITNQFGTVRLKLNPLGQGLNMHDNGYAFVIHHPQNIVGLYRSKINAYRASEETSIIIISFEDQVAQRAKDFVNTLIDEYTERGIDEKTKVATNTIKFIDEQLQQIRDSLNLSEEDIENFKREKGITNLNADFALDRYAEYDGRRLEIELALKSLDSLDSHIRSGKDATLISTSNLGAQDPALSNTLTELNKLEIQRKNLLVNNTSRHHLVRAVNAKIDVTRQELLKNIESFRLALQNNLTTINSTARRFESKLAQIPTTERQFLGIQRNYSLNENIYLLLLERRANASIAKAAAVKDNVVLDYAEYGMLIKPKADLPYIIAVFVSLTLSFSIIFIRDFMDDTISDRAQVEKMTRAPVLGTISHAKNTNSASLVVSQNPKSAVAEAFRSIRTNLQYLASDTENKVVVVTSTISGEGKTFFSLNIASVLAISDKKVLLMGLDLRKPKVHEELNIPSDTGISRVLIGKAKFNEVIFKTGIENLDIMPAGPIPPNPSELIMSNHMKNLMEELRQIYDYIIIDTPPVGLVTDALIAMKYADINVYILRQKTSKRIYLDTINKLHADKTIRNLAIVLNESVKGIGDDAAVIDTGGDYYWLVSTDMLVEGVHFDLSYVPLQHLGYKAVAVNISDIAAMNGIPKQITVSIALSNRFSVEAIEALYTGIKLACKQYKVDLVGGDTTSSKSGLIISITALGSVEKSKVVYRHTAQPNDIICATGDLGGAYMGLQILEQEKQVFLSNPDMQPQLEDKDYILQRQLKPEARMDIIHELTDLGVVPTAMIDISDGLASELMHICYRSKTGAVIYEDKLPINGITYNTAAAYNIDPTTCALNGGEDYELLFTIKQEDFQKVKNHPDISFIGYMTNTPKDIHLVSKSGTSVPIRAQGWIHF